jgi:hypothetical protein
MDIREGNHKWRPTSGNDESGNDEKTSTNPIKSDNTGINAEEL